jgi:hypothetical protein
MFRYYIAFDFQQVPANANIGAFAFITVFAAERDETANDAADA